jgi:hypothetical protein
MTNLIITEYNSITSTYGIVGSQSIQYSLFFMSVFKTNIFSKIINTKDLINSLESTKEELFYDILEKVRKQISSIYNIFNFVFEPNHEMLGRLVELTMNFDASKIEIKSLIDDCFIAHLNKENLSVVKDYVKFYNNSKLIKWIVKLSNIQQTDRILDANCKINSFYDVIRELQQTKKQKENLNVNLYGLQSNNVYRSFSFINNLFKYNETFENNISLNDPLINDIGINGSSMYDLIFLDMPYGIHNVIHANCCQKIKKLKLRGTKAEPLLLQLVMSSLNKNGRGILIVPDSLLFSDSIQPVETREYLLNNFNVKKIIQIDESLYWGNKITRDLKSQSSIIKNSIIIFENNGKTKSVEFSKIIDKENEIVETKLGEIKFEQFFSNGYLLYYKKYCENLENSSNKITFMSVKELFEQIENSNGLKQEQKAIGIAKNYKGTNSIEIIDKNTSNDLLEGFTLFLKEKISETMVPNYCTYYLEYKLKSESEKYTKGKMAQFDINKIYEIKIPIISKIKQGAVCSYLSVTNTVINENNKKIELCNQLINSLMETLPTDKMIKIESIANLYQSNELNKADINNVIGIVKNGLGAGTVYLPNSQLSNNSHYLLIKNPSEYTKEYIFEYLKYSQDEIKADANLTPQPNLTKSFVMNFMIPDIYIENQNHIISHCEIFNKSIERFTWSNFQIKEKDIISTIIKINGF